MKNVLIIYLWIACSGATEMSAHADTALAQEKLNFRKINRNIDTYLQNQRLQEEEVYSIGFDPKSQLDETGGFLGLECSGPECFAIWDQSNPSRLGSFRFQASAQPPEKEQDPKYEIRFEMHLTLETDTLSFLQFVLSEITTQLKLRRQQIDLSESTTIRIDHLVSLLDRYSEPNTGWMEYYALFSELRTLSLSSAIAKYEPKTNEGLDLLQSANSFQIDLLYPAGLKMRLPQLQGNNPKLMNLADPFGFVRATDRTATTKNQIWFDGVSLRLEEDLITYEFQAKGSYQTHRYHIAESWGNQYLSSLLEVPQDQNAPHQVYQSIGTLNRQFVELLNGSLLKKRIQEMVTISLPD